MSNSLIVDAPPPMGVFDHFEIYQQNHDLLLEDVDPRVLTKAAKKNLKSRHKELSKYLKKVGFFGLYEQYVELSKQGNELKQELRRLRSFINDHSIPRSERFRLHIRYFNCKRDYKQAKSDFQDMSGRISAYIPTYRQYKQIEQRLTEHDTANELAKQQRRLRKQLKKEARIIGNLLIERWAQLKQHEDYHVDGKRHRRKVKFERCFVSEEYIWYQIAVSSLGLFGKEKNKLPYGVRVAKLIDKDTLFELAATVERDVWTPHRVDQLEQAVDNGVWIRVNRLSAHNSLPNMVTLNQVWARYDRDNHKLLPMALGIQIGRVINWKHLAEHPHIMINGATGTGKSNAINSIVTTLMKFHTPDEIRFIFVDLKRGIELKQYEDASHTIGSVVYEANQLADTLQKAVDVMHSRLSTMTELNTKNIDAFNRVAPESKRIPRILMVVDEIQDVAGTHEGKIIFGLLRKIVQQGRAAGIHVLMGTQTPYSNTIPKEIKANFAITLVGRMKGLGASMSALGNQKAQKLPKIAGRMWIEVGADVEMVQLPFCTDDNVREAIKHSKLYESNDTEFDTPLEAKSFVLTEEMLIDIAINEFEGVLGYRPIHDHIKDEFVVSRNDIANMVSEIVSRGECYHVDNHYIVKPYRRGSRLELAPNGVTHDAV